MTRIPYQRPAEENYVKGLFRDIGPTIAYGALLLLVVFGIWAAANWAGSLITPKVLHHETEQAHCYTAGKMFFVSIACVPKN